MPLVSCPACKGLTPSSSIRCVHCGRHPPTCEECLGSGRCPNCGVPTTQGYVDIAGGVQVCNRCNGTKICPACEGQKWRWPVPR